MKETKIEKNEFCEEVHAHDETVKKVKASLSDADLLFDVAELFKIFGDSTRVNILATLSKNELCAASPYFQPAHGGQGTLGVRPVRKEEA